MNKKWEWTEVTDEEFEARRKEQTYYKLYFITKDGYDIILYKFWANSDEDAFNTLQKYIKDNPPSGDMLEGTGPFYSTSGYYVSHTGKHYDSLTAMHKFEDKENMFTKFIDFFRYTIPAKWSDFTWKISKLKYFLKTGRIKGEAWDIHWHMVELLKTNLPIMMKNLNGFPAYIEEMVKGGADSPNFEGHSILLDEKTTNRGVELWKSELNKLYHDVLAYVYYSDFGIVDPEDKAMVEIDKELQPTLPYKPGTNKSFDYVKLDNLIKTHWDNIWDWMKKYGQNLWD